MCFGIGPPGLLRTSDKVGLAEPQLSHCKVQVNGAPWHLWDVEIQ